jgi:sugar transferase (PEP-CTERM/EpsH1 system associated)
LPTRPELLFVAQRIPYPPNKGEKIRAWKTLAYLARRFTVHLGCLVDDPADWQHVAVLRETGGGECHFAPLAPRRAKLLSARALTSRDPLTKVYFHNAALAAWIRDLASRRRLDAAFIFSSAMAPYIDGVPVRPHRIVMDYVDVDSDKWRQYAATRQHPLRWLYARESRTLLDLERRSGSLADALVFASPAEADLFRRLAPELAAKTCSVSNGVDAAFFSPEHIFDNPIAGGGPAFVFTGTMSYWPNIDAVTWFSHEVLPLIRAQEPGAMFYIVGANPMGKVVQLGTLPGVVVTGRVADVRPYLAHARAVVAPLRIANGVQNKVLEAMAMAKAVVATPRALAGIECDRRSEVIAADGPEPFAAACIAVLARTDLGEIGARARARICADYSWDANLAGFNSLLAV